MNQATLLVVTVIGGALLILAIGHIRNTVINIISAPPLGVLVATVPSLMSTELWLNRAMWVVASIAVYVMLSYVKDAPPLDFSRALIGMKRRRAARKAVRSEINRIGIFEVDA